jgi:histidinol-phosphate aminotransferase
VAALERAQPLWAVSTPALAAAVACVEPAALAEAAEAARTVVGDRAYLLARLADFPGAEVAGDAPAAPFVLLRVPGAADVRLRLRALGYAVRRADTFPGLGPDWLRIAVRDRRTTDGFANALATALAEHPGPEPRQAGAYAEPLARLYCLTPSAVRSTPPSTCCT